MLASTSPRRRELLERIGARFQVVAPDEAAEAGLRAGRTIRDTALAVAAAAEAKAASVLTQVPRGSLVIGADTVVLLGGRLLGKPRDATEAGRMLRALSGRTHRVVTAVAVLQAGKERKESAWEETRVRFRSLDDEEIAGYVASGEPLDKAGAYGIQGLGGLLVERVDGCFYNVVGLPLATLHRLLRPLGHDLLLANVAPAAGKDLAPRGGMAGSTKG